MEYHEIYFTENQFQTLNNFSKIDLSLSYETFLNLLSNVSKSKNKWKFFKKYFKSYRYKDLTLEKYDNDEIKVYSKNINSIFTQKENNLLHLKQTKGKKPFHVFPSSMNINEIFLTKRLIFRVNNRIYLNFDVVKCEKTGQILYKSFINFNCDSGVDIENANLLINSLISDVKTKCMP